MVLRWQDVKALYLQGKTDAEIAALYGCTPPLCRADTGKHRIEVNQQAGEK